MESVLDSGKILGDRYRVLYELGRSRWGRTYLAEDTQPTGKRYALKELALRANERSQLNATTQRLKEATQSFNQLQHSQLPQFQEVLVAETRLFLVRDYIEGLSYRELLQARQQQGRCFSEAEVRGCLAQVLPVLAYLHQHGIIHQDICLENLILRHRDRLPVPIDFGSLKSVAAELGIEDSQDAVGRLGYAPQEQIQQGRISPQSDLHALGVTALVLLTGREPHQLVSLPDSEWDWQKIPSSPEFGEILRRMLAKQASDRFPCAPEVLSALKACPPPSQPAVEVPDLELPPYPPVPPFHRRLLGFGSKTALVLFLSGTAGTMGWLAGNAWIGSQVNQPEAPSPAEIPSPKQTPETPPEALSFPPRNDLEPEPDEELSAAEQARQRALRDRRVQLGIDYEFFTALVESQFEVQYPSQAGRTLSNTSEDAPWRDRRHEIASELLDRLSSLRSEARLGLGRYTQDKRDRWSRAANALHVSSRALFDLADAAFFSRFPEQEERDFRNEPMGQVWSAIAFEQLQALQSGEALEEIVLTDDVLGNLANGTLEPGTGKVFVAQLEASQFLDVALNTSQTALFSLYSPTGNFILLEDSNSHSWSGELRESGFYEFVVVSKTAERLDYRLSFAIANPSDGDAEL